MSAAALVASLEARGVTLRPTERGTLAIRPADLLAPSEVEALRQHKGAVLALLHARLDASLGAEREDYEERAAIMEFDGGMGRPEAEQGARAMFPWPATLGGAPRVLGTFGRCSRCSSDAHPSRAGTWVSYGSERYCRTHAILAEIVERGTS